MKETSVNELLPAVPQLVSPVFEWKEKAIVPSPLAATVTTVSGIGSGGSVGGVVGVAPVVSVIDTVIDTTVANMPPPVLSVPAAVNVPAVLATVVTASTNAVLNSGVVVSAVNVNGLIDTGGPTTDCSLLKHTFKHAPHCDTNSKLHVYPLLITAIGRSATKYMQESLASIGADISHDNTEIGRQGAVAWPLAVRETGHLNPVYTLLLCTAAVHLIHYTAAVHMIHDTYT